jgi:hypothetical protein
VFPEVQTEYPALSGRKNAISFRKLVESSGLYEKRSLCPDFIATFVAGLFEGLSQFIQKSRENILTGHGVDLLSPNQEPSYLANLDHSGATIHLASKEISPRLPNNPETNPRSTRESTFRMVR